MSDISDIKTWPDERLAECADDDNELCGAKYLERRRQVKEKKVEEDWKKVEEEAARRAEVVRQAEETVRRAAAEAKRRNVEEAVKKWVSTILTISWSVLTTTRPRRSEWSRAL